MAGRARAPAFSASNKRAIIASELAARAERAAQTLLDAGVGRGDVVSLRLARDPAREGGALQRIAALYGIWIRGAVAAPLHERLRSRERAACEALVSPAAAVFGEDGRLRAVRLNPPQAGPGRPPSKSAALLFTSGTSGRPRAVALSAAALRSSALAAAKRMELGEASISASPLSIAHVGGLAVIVRTLASGGALLGWESYDAARIATDLARGNLSHLSVVPAMLKEILDALGKRSAHARVRRILSGGAKTSAQLVRRALRRRIPLALTWGMTETASQIATATPEETRLAPWSVGRPLDGFSVREARDGRLLVRGPALASAVSESPAEGFRPLPLESGGWYRTLDLGRVGEGGRVEVRGRSDFMMIAGGLNVHPAQVEDVIEEMPETGEAVVFGVPDEVRGERIMAVVESPARSLTEREVLEYCRRRLGGARSPSKVHLVGELPRTPSGKAARRGIARVFGEAGERE